MVISMFDTIRFIFVHVPRTSGSSVTYAMREAGNLVCQDKNLGQLDGTPTIGYVPHRALGAHNYIGISGHFHHTKYDDLKVPKITWMRDPVERVISQWNITRMKVITPRSGEVHKKTLRKKLTVTEFSCLSEVRNLMTQYLESMDKFDFIGFAESWDEDVEELFKQFNFGEVPYKLPMVNATPIRRKFVRHVSRDERKALKEINYRDCKLYENAWERFKGGQP